MPVACCSSCEYVGQRWEQAQEAVCGVVPVADIVPVLPAGTLAGTREGPPC